MSPPFTVELSIVGIHHIALIGSPVDGHLGYFQVRAVVTKAAMNISNVSLCRHVFPFLLRSRRISRSCDKFILCKKLPIYKVAV